MAARKVGTKTLLAALFVLLIQFIGAMPPFVRFLSWSSDLTLLYLLVIVEILLFPFVFLIPLNYFLQKTKVKRNIEALFFYLVVYFISLILYTGTVFGIWPRVLSEFLTYVFLNVGYPIIMLIRIFSKDLGGWGYGIHLMAMSSIVIISTVLTAVFALYLRTRQHN